MSNEQLENVAIEADFIVNGYAFTKTSGGNYRVLNLNNKGKTAALLDREGKMLETSMDDIRWPAIFAAQTLRPCTPSA